MKAATVSCVHPERIWNIYDLRNMHVQYLRIVKSFVPEMRRRQSFRPTFVTGS